MSQLLAQRTLPIGQQAVSQGLPGTDGYSVTNSAGGFGPFIAGIMRGVLVIAALLVLFYLIWGAIEWITAGGDKGKVEKARNRITQAVIGLIVLAATTAIFMVVQSFLGVQIINFV